MTDRTPIFKHGHIIKLTRLLNMLYRPAEIADEIGVNVDTVYRSYLPAGAPYERDQEGNIWINGPAFREWAFVQIGARKRKKHPLEDGEGWCLKCNQVVKIQKPKARATNRYLALIQGKCPICGSKVNRAISHAVLDQISQNGKGASHE
jgi:hypothetical protein